MIRFHAWWIAGLAASAAAAMPPEPAPIVASFPASTRQHLLFDDVEGLARLAWQGTRHPDPSVRLAAVEQMVRCCTHPRRVDMVLATIEANEPSWPVQQAAKRVRCHLRMEMENMKWVVGESEAAEGRSVVAHDPLPYREALADLRQTDSTMIQDAPSAGAATPKASSAQLRWADALSATRSDNSQHLPRKGN